MKVVFILPYFGKLKSYFNLFLKTLSYNENVDLLLITDNKMENNAMKNLKVINISFENFRKKIQDKFDFKISLDTPYKLCDFKPAYGYICEEWISEYDYWGYCDCDVLFGDLSPIFSIMEKSYDRIFIAGHLSIYKNTKNNNRVFMCEHPSYGNLHKIVYSSERIFAFDEVYYKVSVNDLFVAKNAQIYEDDLAYNVSTKRSLISRVTFNKSTRKWEHEKSRNDQLYWENGHIYRLRYEQMKRKKDEFLYIHLQLRKMEYNAKLLDDSVIKIKYSGFYGMKHIPNNYIEYLFQKNFYINFNMIKSSIFSWLYRNDITHLRFQRPWEYNPYLSDEFN